MSSENQLKSVLEGIKNSGKIDFSRLKELSIQEQQLVKELYNDGLVNEALTFIDDLDPDREWISIKERIAPSKVEVKPLYKSLLKYAAIFIGLLTIAYFIKTESTPIHTTQISEESIKLKIGEDATEIIHEGEKGRLVSVAGKVVGKQEGNMIHYDPNAKIDDLIYNELDIPYGKIFEVELSDGTLIHLNSGTKLRFPVKFLKGQNREVFIDGEAYFKVAKDKKHPFVVHAGDVAVKVLGTEFNVSSYKEDHGVQTVLVEGSVSMSNSIVPKDTVLLKPGHEALWNNLAHTTEIKEVDVNLYTGWTKGELAFKNATFEEIFKKLERRYNVIIKNDNLTLKGKLLNARFNVNVETIEDILESLSEIQSFKYKIAGQKITIE